jgi:hypothetical protein
LQIDLVDLHYVHLVRVITRNAEFSNMSVVVSDTEAFRAGSKCILGPRNVSGLDSDVNTFS